MIKFGSQALSKSQMKAVRGGTVYVNCAVIGADGEYVTSIIGCGDTLADAISAVYSGLPDSCNAQDCMPYEAE